jgi:hypothetical protein
LLSKSFEAVGIGVVTIAGLFALSFFVLMPISAGHWALDRFGHPMDHDAVIIRQDQSAKPLWLCTDGTDTEPLNCFSAADVVKLLRQKRLALAE